MKLLRLNVINWSLFFFFFRLRREYIFTLFYLLIIFKILIYPINWISKISIYQNKKKKKKKNKKKKKKKIHIIYHIYIWFI